MTESKFHQFKSLGRSVSCQCLNIDLLVLSCCNHCSYAITTPASPDKDNDYVAF